MAARDARAASSSARSIDVSNIRATIHPACHVYKMVPEDVIYDETVMDGNRVAVSTGLMQTLGAQVIDYSTWYDCCGFGFRHIIGEREFTRSFAIDRKIKVAVEEATADVMIGHDTGCITTLDKNQWIGKAVDKVYALPIMADCQFAALALGAHPYKLAQLHWHASPFETLLEKIGIDWEKAKVEFERLSRRGQGRAHRDALRSQARDHLGPGLCQAQGHRRTAQEAKPMNRPVLIVGGGPAGLVRGACAGCSNGQRVDAGREGRPPRRRADPVGLCQAGADRANGRRTPSAAWSRGSTSNPLVEVASERHGESLRRRARRFPRDAVPTARRSRRRPRSCAPASRISTPVNKPEWGFGTYPDVVTTTQVEQMISSGKGVRCPSDGRVPERVAILLCVGSRDRQIGREWCSKICCTVSANLAMEIREALPNATSTSTTWISAPSASTRTIYYWESQEEHKVKYIKARIAEVTSDGKRLLVKGEDTLVKRPITIPFDMVVHAIGMDPNVDNMTLSAVFDVKLETHGHIDKASTYSDDVGDHRGRACSSPARRRDPRRSTIPSRRASPPQWRRWRCSRSARAGGGRMMWAIAASEGTGACPGSGRCSTCPVRSCGAPSRTSWQSAEDDGRHRALCRRAGAQGLAVRGSARQGQGAAS